MDNIFLCFIVPQTVNNPILYAAITTLWLVQFPGFIIISSVSGIVNVMCLVVPVAACLLILCSLGAILIAQWSWIYRMWTQSVCKHTQKYRHQSCQNDGNIFPTCWSNRNLCNVNSILKELYRIYEGSLDVVKVELWFIIDILNFSRGRFFFFFR